MFRALAFSKYLLNEFFLLILSEASKSTVFRSFCKMSTLVAKVQLHAEKHNSHRLQQVADLLVTRFH